MLLLLLFPASSIQSVLVVWVSHRIAASLNVKVRRTWLFTLLSSRSSSLLPYLCIFHPFQIPRIPLLCSFSDSLRLWGGQKLLSLTVNILVNNRLTNYFFHCYLAFQGIYCRETPKGISLKQLNCRYHVPWSISYSWRGEEVGRPFPVTLESQKSGNLRSHLQEPRLVYSNFAEGPHLLPYLVPAPIPRR